MRANEPAPDFRVTTLDGQPLDSRELVGKRAFMLVFLATWCGVCEYKLPLVRSMAERYAADVQTILVFVDDESTRSQVPEYIERHSLRFPSVDGMRFPRFAIAYDPSSTVPVVAVFGKNGYLVDYQLGVTGRDARRLSAALELARLTPADAPPFDSGAAVP